MTSSNCFFFSKQNQNSPKPQNSRTGSKSVQTLQIFLIVEPANAPENKKITDKKNNQELFPAHFEISA